MIFNGQHILRNIYNAFDYTAHSDKNSFGVTTMSGLLDEFGKIVGAIAAEQAVDKLDSDAGFLEKTAGAFAGYEAAKVAEDKLENHDEEAE